MGNLSNLLIISDTKIQKRGNRYFGFNSVVLELEVFNKLFDQITWIAFDYSDLAKDKSLLEITESNIKLILLPRSGGKTIWSKLKIFFNIPLYLFNIINQVRRHKFIHVRGPSGPMFLAHIVSLLCFRKQWFFKYANNWNDSTPPVFWHLQKKFMIQQSWIKGMVNGQWPDMPPHLLALENPCIHGSELGDLNLSKFDNNPKRLLFVGRIEFEKGILIFLESLSRVNLEKIDTISIVGMGKNIKYLNEFLSNNLLDVKIEYLGSQSKESVVNLMKLSHFLVLPTTASEGFPKVVAEAWSVGCLPISSNISSIGQYVKHHGNGFIWDYSRKIDFAEILNDALEFDSAKLSELVKNGFDESQKFTYVNYEKRLNSIFNLN